MKFKNIHILSLVISLIFIASGISKLFAIDEFQIFIYGLKIVNLNISMILARLVIGAEIAIGLLYFFRIYLKPVSVITLCMLLGFTAFIVYLMLSGSTEDCHCFGNVLKFSNTATILKNVLIILMVVYLYRTYNAERNKNSLLILSISLLVSFSSTFIVRPPDLLLAKTDNANTYYNKSVLEKFLNKTKLNNKKLVVCFLSPKCKYCQLTARKMSILSEKISNKDCIYYVFWITDDYKGNFFEETKTHKFNTVNMDVIEFLNLTNGTMPLVIMINKGQVLKAFRYKDFDEQEVMNFLN